MMNRGEVEETWISASHRDQILRVTLILYVALVVAACDSRATPTTVVLPGSDLSVPEDDPRYSDPMHSTSPIVTCINSRPQTVDYRPFEACVDLFRRLASCCTNTLLVKTYVFEVLLHACNLEPELSNEVCAKHLAAAKVGDHCTALKNHPRCTDTTQGCGGGSHGGLGGGKNCRYEGACHPGGTKFSCTPTDSGYRCECTEGSTQTATCVSADICDIEGSFGFYLRMDECCGWKLSSPGEGAFSGKIRR